MFDLIPSFFIILLLLGYLYKRGARHGALLVMFVYASLHSVYVLSVAVNSNNGAEMMVQVHQSHSVVFSVIGATFIGICVVAMVVGISNKNYGIKKHYFLLFCLFLTVAMFFVSMLLHLDMVQDAYGARAQVLKEIVSSVMMWVLMAVIAISVRYEEINISVYRKDIVFFLGALLLIMPVLGLYEISTGVVWARTGVAERASATLFNPNVLGLWCALVTLLISLLFNLGWLSKRLVFLFMVLLVMSLTLSGSRSGLILSTVNLLVISYMLSVNKGISKISILDKLWPLVMFMLSFLVVAIGIDLLRLSEVRDANIYFANLQRFVLFPSEVPGVVFHQVGGHVELGKTNTNFVNYATLESVNGRLEVGVFSDNLYLAIYALGGYVSLFLWFVLCGTMLWFVLKKYMANPCVYSMYSLVATMACIVSGVFLRSAQLFPLWVFMSIALGLSMKWSLLDRVEVD